MNTQSSTAAVSLLESGFHISLSRFRQCQLGHAGQSSQRHQNRYDNQLNATSFEQLLYWLSPDRDTAGRKYESIRSRLITRFKSRRCAFPEDLADVTFDRVARKLTDLTIRFTGDPLPYFYGVAEKIYLEHQREITTRRNCRSNALPTHDENPELENMLNKLDQALSRIHESERELILRYYDWDGNSKIDIRRALAKQLGLEPQALRVRVFRIRRKIKNYIVNPAATPSVSSTETN